MFAQRREGFCAATAGGECYRSRVDLFYFSLDHFDFSVALGGALFFMVLSTDLLRIHPEWQPLGFGIVLDEAELDRSQRDGKRVDENDEAKDGRDIGSLRWDLHSDKGW